MSKIAVGRVVRGGLVAGLVMNVLDYVVNVTLLGNGWDEYTRALGVDPPEVATLAIGGWVVSDFAFGLLLVWLYAAIRPRFGPGAGTALIATLAVWGVSHLAYAALFFMGMFPPGIVLRSAGGALVGWSVAGLLGCRMYREA
jgi:hypothetical protein